MFRVGAIVSAIGCFIRPGKNVSLAARANGNRTLPYNFWTVWQPMPVMAHTNPIYVDVNGERIWSRDAAAFLIKQCELAIEWARTRARFHTTEQREATIRLYEEDKAFYVNHQKPN